jgi:hypothetical protein
MALKFTSPDIGDSYAWSVGAGMSTAGVSSGISASWTNYFYVGEYDITTRKFVQTSGAI